MEHSQTSPWTKESTYDTIRQFLGYAGIAFPFVLLAGSIFISECYWIQKSISAYYHTIMGPVFVGFLCAFAMFLFLYRGENKQDRNASKTAAFFAILVALSPCLVDPAQPLCQVQPFPFLSYKVFHYIHLASAAGFFITQTYFTFFLFTKTKAVRDASITMQVVPNFFGVYATEQKVKMENLDQVLPKKSSRNTFYRLCGRVMLICTVLIAVYGLLLEGKYQQLDFFRPTFILETIALFFFGSAWLVKSQKHNFWKDNQEVD
jgi:hypothetical protein